MKNIGVIVLLVYSLSFGKIISCDEVCDAVIRDEENIKEDSRENWWNRNSKLSLGIVFDTTGSMGSDLKQLREAAEIIVNRFSFDESNPIDNYILSKFNDPSK
jgi:hypothetical protein